MERIQFSCQAEKGLDVRCAGEFVKEAIKCDGKVTIRNGTKQGDAKLIFNVMSLNIRKGDEIVIEINGGNETEDAARLKSFVEDNL